MINKQQFNMAASTSFQKRSKLKFRPIPGTKPSLYNNQLLISTGVPSLDAVLGGGLAVGTVLLVEEDLYGTYAQVMLKYFTAEAIMTGHVLAVASADQDPHSLIRELPAPVVDDLSPGHNEKLEVAASDVASEDKMKIAWRYQNNPKIQTTPSASKFGHYYDLSKPMDENKVNSATVHYITYSDLLAHEATLSQGSSYTNCRYAFLAQKIRKFIEDGNFSTSVKAENRNILRIAIQGLGSPMWGENAGMCHHSEERDNSLLQFLIVLRAILRSAFAACFITVPMHLFQHDPAFVWRAEQLCDTVLRLQSFAESQKDKSPVFKDYTGLLYLLQIPCLNELVPHMPDTLDLAFRLRRKRFTIERLHLPPELSNITGREDEDSVPSSGCGSTGLSSVNKLDF